MATSPLHSRTTIPQKHEYYKIVLLGDPGVGKESICRKLNSSFIPHPVPPLHLPSPTPTPLLPLPLPSLFSITNKPKFTTGQSSATYDPTDSGSYRKMSTLNSRPCVLELLPLPTTTSATAARIDYTPYRSQIHRVSDGTILIYAVNSRDSFSHIPRYYHEILSAKSKITAATSRRKVVGEVGGKEGAEGGEGDGRGEEGKAKVGAKGEVGGGEGTGDGVAVILVASKQDRPSHEHLVSTEEGEKLAESLGDGGCPFLEVSSRWEGSVDFVFEGVVREIWRLRVERDDAVAVSVERPKHGFGNFIQQLLRWRK